MIVDDHPTVREGLGHCISAQPDMVVCGEAVDVTGAVSKIAETAPDVVIVDIALKDSSGLDLIKTVKTRFKKTIMLAHSMYDDQLYANRCLRAGAMGYVNKTADPREVIHAIRDVVRGYVYLNPEITSDLLSHNAPGGRARANPMDVLTDRQLEIFRLIGDGLSTSQIAARLHISVHTVETHRENIKHRLRIKSAVELNRYAVLWGAASR